MPFSERLIGGLQKQLDIYKKELHTMTKTELTQKVSDLTGVPEKATANVINIAMESIVIALQRGETVALPGFGTFSVTHREERQGRNLQTGEPMTIPAHNIPSFKPGKGLRYAVR